MEFLGIPLKGAELEFPLWEEDFSALQTIAEVRDLKPGEYVCVHPGASVRSSCRSLQVGQRIAAVLTHIQLS